MNTIEAAKETLQLAHAYGMHNCDVGEDSLQYEHLETMLLQMQGEMDEAKRNRYLGWIQCAVVAFGVSEENRPTLEMMKEINRKWL